MSPCHGEEHGFESRSVRQNGRVAKRQTQLTVNQFPLWFIGSSPIPPTSLLGCSQAVRHEALNLICGGSIPPIPASDKDDKLTGPTPVSSSPGGCAGAQAGMPSIITLCRSLV